MGIFEGSGNLNAPTIFYQYFEPWFLIRFKYIDSPVEVPVVNKHRSFLPEVSYLAISCNEYPGYKLIVATTGAF